MNFGILRKCLVVIAVMFIGAILYDVGWFMWRDFRLRDRVRMDIAVAASNDSVSNYCMIPCAGRPVREPTAYFGRLGSSGSEYADPLLYNRRTSNIVYKVQPGQRVGCDNPAFSVREVLLDRVVVTNSIGERREILPMEANSSNFPLIRAIGRAAAARASEVPMHTNGATTDQRGGAGAVQNAAPAQGLPATNHEMTAMEYLTNTINSLTRLTNVSHAAGAPSEGGNQ